MTEKKVEGADTAYQVGQIVHREQPHRRGGLEASKTETTQEAQAKLLELRKRLGDTSARGFNPIIELRKVLGLGVLEMAGLAYFSPSRWYGIEAGAISSVPRAILELAEEFLGAGAASEFEAAWIRFRANLTEDVRRKLQERYFPPALNGQWGVE